MARRKNARAKEDGAKPAADLVEAAEEELHEEPPAFKAKFGPPPPLPPRARDSGRADADAGAYSLRAPKMSVNFGDEREVHPCVAWSIVGTLVAVLAVFLALERFSLHTSGLIPLFHTTVAYGVHAEEIPARMDGKTFLVTGGSGDIGRRTAHIFAACNATVILTCHDLAVCETTAASIREHAVGRIVPLAVDLAALQSVRGLIAAVRNITDRLDGMALLAGALPNGRQVTTDGVESAFAVNYLGHFALVQALTDLLLAAPRASVVLVGSSAHAAAFPSAAGVPLTSDEASWPGEYHYDAVRAFGAAHLANILYAGELHRRHHNSGLRACVVSPGLVATAFWDKTLGRGRALQSAREPLFRLLNLLRPYLFWQPGLPAIAMAVAVAEPRWAGEYVVPHGRPFAPTAQARNETTAARLWEFSAQLVASSSTDPSAGGSGGEGHGGGVA